MTLRQFFLSLFLGIAIGAFSVLIWQRNVREDIQKEIIDLRTQKRASDSLATHYEDLAKSKDSVIDNVNETNRLLEMQVSIIENKLKYEKPIYVQRTIPDAQSEFDRRFGASDTRLYTRK